MKRLWLGFASVLVLSFSVLGWIGTRVYQQAPPIPLRVVTTDGQMMVGDREIESGQNPYQPTYVVPQAG